MEEMRLSTPTTIFVKKQNYTSRSKSNYLPIANGYKTVNTLEDFEKLTLKNFTKIMV